MNCKEYKIIAIIPAFNEEKNIRRVIEDIKKHQPKVKIVVINDASTDNTEIEAKKSGGTVITLPLNLGIGGAVQTGLKYAKESDFDIAIQVDGDGQHMASQIEKIIRPVINSEADVVIGSRFLAKGDYKLKFWRRIGISIFSLVNTFMIGQKITDNTSGFRAYNKKAISFLSQFYPQDYPEPEAVVELYRNKFRIKEVPVLMRKREGGGSSIDTLDSVYYVVKVLMANFIAFSRKPVFREDNNGH